MVERLLESISGHGYEGTPDPFVSTVVNGLREARSYGVSFEDAWEQSLAVVPLDCRIGWTDKAPDDDESQLDFLRRVTHKFY